MFEARLTNGVVLKKLVEALKDLVTDANIDCSEEGLSIQAMDSSHVSLCAVALRAEGFDHYRSDRKISLGFNSGNLGKILKCSGNDDIITLKAEDSAEVLTLMFESEDAQRISDFDLKLMDIESDHLGIPEMEYKTTIRMPSAEFQRIIRDLGVLGDTCTISVTKEGIRFSVNGDLGNGNILIRSTAGVVDVKEENEVVIDMEEPVEVSIDVYKLA